jgi:hypothetical protein
MVQIEASFAKIQAATGLTTTAGLHLLYTCLHLIWRLAITARLGRYYLSVIALYHF